MPSASREAPLKPPIPRAKLWVPSVTDLRSGLYVCVRSYGSKPASGQSPFKVYNSKPESLGFETFL